MESTPARTCCSSRVWSVGKRVRILKEGPTYCMVVESEFEDGLRKRVRT